MQSSWGSSTGFDTGFDTGWGDDSKFMPDLPSYADGQKKFHRRMFIFALIGAVIGTVISLILFARIYDPDGSNIWQVGLVLAIICGMVILACVICELVSPRITVNHELTAAAFLLALVGTALIFAVGCLFEFIYEIGGVIAPIEFNDFVFAIDDSGSMQGTDSSFLRYSALEALLDTMDEDKRVGVIHFTEDIAREPVQIDYLTDAHRSDLKNDLAVLQSDGNTDIQGALEAALSMYEQNGLGGRSPVVVLLSDGGSSVQVSKLSNDYIDAGIAITTVSLGQGADSGLLQSIAQATGGQYIDVENAEELISAFQHVSTAVARRCLFTSRPGPQRNSVLYTILRVVFLAVPGLLVALFLVIIFRERGVERQFIVSGITGLLSGIVMEVGTRLFLPQTPVRILSWLLYGIVLLTYIEYNNKIHQTDLSDKFVVSQPDAFERIYNKVGEAKLKKDTDGQGEKKITRGDDGWGD